MILAKIISNSCYINTVSTNNNVYCDSNLVDDIG